MSKQTSEQSSIIPYGVVLKKVGISNPQSQAKCSFSLGYGIDLYYFSCVTNNEVF